MLKRAPLGAALAAYLMISGCSSTSTNDAASAPSESAAASDARRQAVTQTLLELAILTAFLLVALGGLALVFLRLMRRSRAQIRQNSLTSARLQTIFSTSADAIIVPLLR